MTDPIRVDIVSDVVCPWCVIGYHQLARAAGDTGLSIEVHWHPFELNPQMPPEGENLREHLAAKYGTTPEGSRQARARLTEMGAELGFTFDYSGDMRMVNTFRAHQLIDWAAGQGRGHEMNMAIFEAVFTLRENVDDPSVLADLAAGIGLERDGATAVLEAAAHAPIVREKERFWTSRGISGVPAMIFDRRHLVTGAQGEEAYARILRQLAGESAA